ncbi:MAG: class I SAM-dependent methyltransferase [Myxococcota bacterium]
MVAAFYDQAASIAADRDSAARAGDRDPAGASAAHSLAPYLAGARAAAFNPYDSWAQHFPESPRREEIDILVAGPGTAAVAMLAARMPRARIVGVDTAATAVPREGALRGHAEPDRVSFCDLPLERIDELGETFDVVHCHGVLHRLADPAAALRALASVTRPDGVISAMVQAQAGQGGAQLLRELLHRLGIAGDESGAATVAALLEHLPEGHPLVLAPWGERPAPAAEDSNASSAPRPRAYTVDEVRALVTDAGLVLHRWLGQAVYESALSPLADSLSSAGEWTRAAAMELFHGCLTTHSFLLTHPTRATAAELFEGPSIADAVPTLSPHIAAIVEGDTLALHNRALQVPVYLRGPLSTLKPWLQAVDGRTSVGELASLRRNGVLDEAAASDAQALFRSLYLADIIELSTRTAVA